MEKDATYCNGGGRNTVLKYLDGFKAGAGTEAGAGAGNGSVSGKRERRNASGETRAEAAKRERK